MSSWYSRWFDLLGVMYSTDMDYHVVVMNMGPSLIFLTGLLLVIQVGGEGWFQSASSIESSCNYCIVYRW